VKKEKKRNIIGRINEKRKIKSTKNTKKEEKINKNLIELEEEEKENKKIKKEIILVGNNQRKAKVKAKERIENDTKVLNKTKSLINIGGKRRKLEW